MRSKRSKLDADHSDISQAHLKCFASQAIGRAPEIIKGLALDDELVVSGPVLEFSPVLTDDDLLEIIEKGPVKGGLGAIARRSRVNEIIRQSAARIW